MVNNKNKKLYLVLNPCHVHSYSSQIDFATFIYILNLYMQDYFFYKHIC